MIEQLNKQHADRMQNRNSERYKHFLTMYCLLVLFSCFTTYMLIYDDGNNYVITHLTKSLTIQAGSR